MAAANPAASPVPTTRAADLAEDPWLDEDPVPPAEVLAEDPAPEDPERVAAWLAADPGWDQDPWLDGVPGAAGESGRAGNPGPAGGRGRARAAPPVEILKAGRWDRSRGNGGGFAAGGVADTMPPGAVLAGLAGDRWAAGLGQLSDDELIGVLRAARRLTSWAAAMELAAVGDLWRRRTAEEGAGDTGAAWHADAEVAAALTLTRRAADNLLSLAVALDRLPLTQAALAAGDIDVPRAMVIAGEVTGLSDAHAAAVEAAIIGAAPAQTTGQLRLATRRAVLAADPNAARKRKEEALREARVERWTEPAGTAALAGRDLPPAGVLAADANLTALAKQLKAAGVEGTLDILRAKIYLALLTGTPLTSLLPAEAIGGGDPGERRRDGHDGRPGHGAPGAFPSATGAFPSATGALPSATGAFPPVTGACPSAITDTSPAGTPPGAFPALGGFAGAGVAGRVNLTLPLATWLGRSHGPGEVAGYGPLDAADARAIADALAAHAGTKWCLTITGPDGRPVAHGCARTGPPASGHCGEADSKPRAGPPTDPPNKPATRSTGRTRDGAWSFTLTPFGSGACDHAWETPAYRPPAALRHRVDIRHATCVFPGCRRPAAQCDADHTLAYERGGRTCLCNLAPLCRHHHEVKQAPGWRLEQPEPGVLVWRTPAGRTYTTTPAEYPV